MEPLPKKPLSKYRNVVDFIDILLNTKDEEKKKRARKKIIELFMKEREEKTQWIKKYQNLKEILALPCPRCHMLLKKTAFPSLYFCENEGCDANGQIIIGGLEKPIMYDNFCPGCGKPWFKTNTSSGTQDTCIDPKCGVHSIVRKQKKAKVEKE